MIQTCGCFGFAPKTYQRLVLICLMRKDPFYCDDAAGVLLTGAIDNSHATATYLFEDLVVTKAPLFASYIRFEEDAFECVARPFAFGYESLAQETVNTGRVTESGHRAALRAFRRSFECLRGEIRKCG